MKSALRENIEFLERLYDVTADVESDDDTVVEHSEGQTINISNANVVIID